MTSGPPSSRSSMPLPRPIAASFRRIAGTRLTCRPASWRAAAGVELWGCEADDALVGVMGIQPVRDVDLIRHAYVLPAHQRHGVGAALLQHLRQPAERSAHADRH